MLDHLLHIMHKAWAHANFVVITILQFHAKGILDRFYMLLHIAKRRYKL